MSKSSATTVSSTSVNTLPVSVITTCYGRNVHLYNLLASLQAGSKRPAEVIIVNDDADSAKLHSYDLNIIQIPTTASNASTNKDNNDQVAFDIGHNRNLGADCASYDTLIFLDVDCIVATDFIEGMAGTLKQHPQALIMGQPRYLTRPLTERESKLLSNSSNEHSTQGSTTDYWLQSLSILNPYRHNLVSKKPATDRISHNIEKTSDYGSFWSLCFAIHKSQFLRIGGFDTDYIGYGAEDTDFAFTARKLSIDFYLTNDVVYHQQHTVYRPPLNHLHSIVINANRFYQKWHHWPMSGWLENFAQSGLIDWHTAQDNSIKVLRQPTALELKQAHCPDAPFV